MTTVAQLDQLTRREHQVLALMAEGRSNGAIGEQLTVEVKTVEAHISRVFAKLGLAEVTGENRRVLAVLTYCAACEPVSGPTPGPTPRGAGSAQPESLV